MTNHSRAEDEDPSSQKEVMVLKADERLSHLLDAHKAIIDDIIECDRLKLIEIFAMSQLEERDSNLEST